LARFVDFSRRTMAKKRKIPRKDWAAYDERTRLIQARIAELERQIAERKQSEQSRQDA